MKPNTILIVDDEENILKSLERLLEDEGYKMFFANSGDNGLEIMKMKVIKCFLRTAEITDWKL